MRFRHLLSAVLLFGFTVAIVVGCAQKPAIETVDSPTPTPEARDPNAPLVIGYSNWVGWWPWAIAESEGLFAAQGVKVELKWFDSYLESMEALATGEIDGNCQTLSDTISFAGDAVNGEVVVLVNDNSAGNDKIIVSDEIQKITDLAGKKVAVEEGIVGDFLLTLALEKQGMSRDDVDIVPLETAAAVEAFVSEQTDAVGSFAPFWLTALKREGAKELISSAEFPGAIPDLLVMSASAIDSNPDDIQGLIDIWFNVLKWMRENPDRADKIMADRANITLEELELLKRGTRFFSLPDNLEAFAPGDNMQHMQFAAQMMAKFMVNVDFIPKAPDLETLLDDRFIQAYAEQVGDADTSVEDVAALGAANTTSDEPESTKLETETNDIKSGDVN
ncbi:MAG: aliphatic sulfonate ABC transporter substrate-binding protein [Oscillatoriales cyanobacterium]|nr:MAG: aliphatic sulfonate ABC transporter substrate-binding protein [Oscillatoriales cyanobacterium]